MTEAIPGLVADPPANVRAADVRSELAPKIRAVYRRTQGDRKQLGLWLIQCKEETLRRQENWLAWLKRHGDTEAKGAGVYA